MYNTHKCSWVVSGIPEQKIFCDFKSSTQISPLTNYKIHKPSHFIWGLQNIYIPEEKWSFRNLHWRCLSLLNVHFRSHLSIQMIRQVTCRAKSCANFSNKASSTTSYVTALCICIGITADCHFIIIVPCYTFSWEHILRFWKCRSPRSLLKVQTTKLPYKWYIQALHCQETSPTIQLMSALQSNPDLSQYCWAEPERPSHPLQWGVPPRHLYPRIRNRSKCEECCSPWRIGLNAVSNLAIWMMAAWTWAATTLTSRCDS